MSPVGIGTPPTPLPLASVPSPPPGTKGGGHTSLRLRGWGSPNFDDWGYSLALCLFCDSKLLQHLYRQMFGCVANPQC